ncbi:MAG: sugar ABC transporter ATP-binding protein [Lachnospiraceae bacterium]|nr:sugar ABC transporter ATP-binding protein [Lachnospiraceae bacterium]
METSKEKKYVLELRNITKTFPGVKALDNVSFKVEEQTVHVLAGENGAGKSTLIKIINGNYVANEGELYVYGEKVTNHNPKHMQDLGIATIHQELSPVKDLTIAENIFLGRLPKTKLGLVDWKKTYADAQKLIDDLGFHYDAKALMRTLTVSDTQIIEIIKAISVNAKVIIMDEPTSSITGKEVDILHDQVRKLKAQGVSFIYISHKLEEIPVIGDDITVLRDGKSISTDKVKDMTNDMIIARMVGREMTAVYPDKNPKIGDTLLEVKGLTRSGVFEDVSFTLKKGEVLGMAGMVGAGRTEVCRGIFGLDKTTAGEVWLEGKKLNIKSVKDALDCGIIYLSEDRKGEGLVLIRSIQENMALANLKHFSNGLFMKQGKEGKECKQHFDALRIKAPSLKTTAGSLSGGNQQKICIAKWLIREPKVFIMDEPTRGIDVGAKYEIYKIMLDLAETGAGVIMISSELPEIIGTCDRTLVMHEGRITGVVDRSEMTQERIMEFAVGGK